jgi:DNA-binding protein Fis
MEKEHIVRILKEADGNQSRASQILGIDRKTLYLKLKKYGIGQLEVT